MKSLNDDRVHVHMTDVRRAEDVRSFIEAARQAWGRIDVLFSNAGNAGVVAPLAEYPEDVFDSVMAVHVRGAFLVCKYALPHMADFGSIIITSSVWQASLELRACTPTSLPSMRRLV